MVDRSTASSRTSPFEEEEDSRDEFRIIDESSSQVVKFVEQILVHHLP